MNLLALPALVLSRLYGLCDNEAKKNLYNFFESEDELEKLQVCGALRHKPIFQCFLCQLQLFYNEFVKYTISHGENTRRDTLAFHFNYRRLNIRVIDDLAVFHKYTARTKNSYTDRLETNRILTYFINRLTDGFTTNDLSELEKHMRICHSTDRYFPDEFDTADLDSPLDDSVENAMQETLADFRVMHNISARFTDIQLDFCKVSNKRDATGNYVPATEFNLTVTESRSLRNFNMFITNLTQSHSPKGLTLHISSN